MLTKERAEREALDILKSLSKHKSLKDIKSKKLLFCSMGITTSIKNSIVVVKEEDGRSFTFNTGMLFSKCLGRENQVPIDF